MTDQTPGCGSTTDARKRLAESAADEYALAAARVAGVDVEAEDAPQSDPLLTMGGGPSDA